MNTFEIVIAGIVVFVRLGSGVTAPRHIVVPEIKNLSYHKKHISDHQARIAVTPGTADNSAWGPPDGKAVINSTVFEVYNLKGEDLVINAVDNGLDASAQQTILPSLIAWCPGYTLKSSFPIAATMDVDRGILSATGDISKEAVTSTLTVHVNGPLIISVRNSPRHLAIAPNARVRIENSPDTETHNHFLAYYELSQGQTCDDTHFPGSRHALNQGKGRGRDTKGAHASPEPGKGLGADCSNSSYP
jgi:hypothetical protein